jgi:hypothetical protein
VLNATINAKLAMNTVAVNALNSTSLMLLLACALPVVMTADNVPLPLLALSARMTSSLTQQDLARLKTPTVKRRETMDVNNVRLVSMPIRLLDSAQDAHLDVLSAMLPRPATNVLHLSSLPMATENAQLRLGSLFCLLFSVLLLLPVSGKDIALTPRREPLL